MLPLHGRYTRDRSHGKPMRLAERGFCLVAPAVLITCYLLVAGLPYSFRTKL